MTRISTETCKAELNQHWPVEGTKSPEDWKRLSKTGSAKSTIVRIFQHRTLPVFGTVVEEKGAITRVTFADTLPKPAVARKDSYGEGNPQPTQSRVTNRNDTLRKPVEPASNGRVRADEFVFAVCERENRRTKFAICTVDFWRTNHHLSDEGLGDILDGLLPPGTSVSSECQYSNRMSRKELYEFLINQGFCDDERFTQYMDGYQPE